MKIIKDFVFQSLTAFLVVSFFLGFQAFQSGAQAEEMTAHLVISGFLLFFWFAGGLSNRLERVRTENIRSRFPDLLD